MSAFVHHGGRINAAAAEFGGTPQDWLDLSTGINPVPWPGAMATPVDWRALPDPQAVTHLESVASVHFGADPALCCAVPGSEAALRALGAILRLPGRTEGLTYGTYAKAFPPAAADPCVRIVANPNNPDGALATPARLSALLERQERMGGWLLVDEAFGECHPDHSVAGLVAEGRPLIVLRSFGKFFGLAGVRLGFVLAPDAVLQRLRALCGDWPIGAAGIAFGTAAYADARWIAETRKALDARARRLDDILAAHGLSASGACPLFRLVDTPDAPSLFSTLGRHRILSRLFATHPSVLRLGVPGDDVAFERLAVALAQWRG